MFGYRDLLESEERVLATTYAEVGGGVQKYQTVVDVLLKASYFTGDSPDPETDAGLFAFWAHGQYLQLPLTIRAILHLWERGHYLEATMLLRTLSEVLVQLRYFHTRQPELGPHLDPSRGSLRFKDMFDTVVPGYYAKYYGHHSGFVHGKFGPMFFRYERPTAGARRVRLGCEFDWSYLGIIINQLNALVLGFLNYFRVFFPGNTLSTNREFEATFEGARQTVEEALARHKEEFPESRPWYSVIEPLVRV